MRHEPYKRALELYVCISFLMVTESYLPLQKSGALGHCILNDLFEDVGDDGDARDSTAILYTSKLASCTPILGRATDIDREAAADTVRSVPPLS
jgi:hypothetical protein